MAENDIFKNRVASNLDQVAPRKIPLGAYIIKTVDESGFLHSKKDKPAIEMATGTKFYYNHGWLHRLNGAAIIHEDGREEYFIEGKFIPSKEEHTRYSRLLKIQSLDLF
jgi:hypothetical protein